MMTWEEINNIKDRKVYEYEYSVRKTYERLVPIVDELYAMFAIYAWSKGYNDIAKSGARKCWQDFVAVIGRGSPSSIHYYVDFHTCVYFTEKFLRRLSCDKIMEM